MPLVEHTQNGRCGFLRMRGIQFLGIAAIIAAGNQLEAQPQSQNYHRIDARSASRRVPAAIDFWSGRVDTKRAHRHRCLFVD